MTNNSAFGNELLASVPHLRAFARSLCRDRDRADDLVQETLLAAWEKRGALARADAMRPWLFAIMRNGYCGGLRRGRREVEDIDGAYAAELTEAPRQLESLELDEVFVALDALPADQREAVMLVCVEQMSYEAAAIVCRCPAGTVKSRVNRARGVLARELGLDNPEQVPWSRFAVQQPTTRGRARLAVAKG